VPDERSEGTRSTAHSEPRRSKSEAGDENHLKFALILLLAILYGLGLIWEAGSHDYHHEDNVEQKREAFYKVASGKLNSGTASHRLASFVSDYNACHAVVQKGQPKESAPSLCHQVDERVTQFFYNAKNVVFQHREYYEELSLLEARINFMLSFNLLTKWFFRELCVVFVVAVIAEVGKRNRPGLWTRWVNRVFGTSSPSEKSERHKGERRSWREEWRNGAINMGEHWVGIAAFHILLLSGACAGLAALSNQGCVYSEDQFAKRVFGYYLALQSEHLGATENGEARLVAEPVDLTPESPYHVFSLPGEGEPHEGEPAHHLGKASALPVVAAFPPADEDAHQPYGPGAAPAKDAHHHKQRRLEPAAVQILGNTSEVLVASDQGEDEPFWLFTLNEDGTRMEHPRALHVDEAKDRFLLRSVGTIESLAAFEVNGGNNYLPPAGPCSPVGDQKAFRIFVGPNRFGAEQAQLLSFCLKIDPSLRDEEILRIADIEAQPLPSVCEAALDKNTETCFVEGIAFRSNGLQPPELLLGVQQVGARKTVVIVRMTYQKGAWTNPERIFPARDNQCSMDSSIVAMINDGGGISDLAAAPSGRIYVTTSVQGEGRAAKKGSAATPQVGGALWLLDLGCKKDEKGDPCHCSGQKAMLLERFIHKPDGVSHDNGSVLVVFDDEAGLKSSQWAPRTFPLAQNESVLAVVPSPKESE
jgi:hypothetical protein